MRKMLFALAAVAAGLAAAEPFADGERVVWLGDSITQIGSFGHPVRTFYWTRYPDRRIAFFNSGIGGDRASGGLWRYGTDVKPFGPTSLVVMFGMNDVNPFDYQAPEKRDADYAARIAKMADGVFVGYTNDMTRLYARFRADFPRAEFYWCVPSAYDETAVLAKEWHGNHPGANDALGRLGRWIRRQCFRDGGTLVDFHETMTDQMTGCQAGNPSYSLLSPDRVHPSNMGSAFMGYVFLKAQGVNPWVCDVEIDAAKGAVARCAHAAARDVVKTEKGVSFQLKESVLPWPLPRWGGEKIRETLAVDRALNREIVAVTGLPEGDYELKIDGKPCGTWSSGEWAAGINFAGVKKTPMYAQAQKVREVSDEYGELEAKTFVSYNSTRLYFHNTKLCDFDDYEAFKAYYEKNMKGQKGWHNDWAGEALACYGKLDEARAKLDALREKARDLCRTTAHAWTIERTK